MAQKLQYLWQINMRILKNKLFLFCLVLLAFSSCKNKLNLDAPYKEMPSIYAVLNPYEPINIIRINKVFLGQGDANQMAKVADSINYQPGEVTVTLAHSSNPKIITFHDTLLAAADGAFNTNQRGYCTGEALERSGTYTLTVKNNHTGNVFTATANVVGQVSNNQGYQPLAPPYYPYNPNETSGFINYSAPNSSNVVGSVLFQPIDGAKIYQVVIRSNFYNDLGSTQTYDYVDYVFDNPTAIKYIGGGSTQYISISFKSSDYFSAVAVALSQKNLPDALGRKMYLMEYFVRASTQEYADYIEFAKPSLSLNQNKPLYSNFKDQAALGLFTFRSTVVVQKQLDPTFINAFSTNPYTCNYKFYDSNNRVLGCR